MAKTQKVLLINGNGNSIYVLFRSSAPRFFFSIAEQFSKGKQTPTWHSEKRSTLWPEKKFFKSNMDALTVLSIWDTDQHEKDYVLLCISCLCTSLFQ